MVTSAFDWVLCTDGLVCIMKIDLMVVVLAGLLHLVRCTAHSHMRCWVGVADVIDVPELSKALAPQQICIAKGNWPHTNTKVLQGDPCAKFRAFVSLFRSSANCSTICRQTARRRPSRTEVQTRPNTIPRTSALRQRCSRRRHGSGSQRYAVQSSLRVT